MKSSILIIKIDPSKLAFLKFILEGYDHLAVLTIIDGKTGLAKLHFHPKNYIFLRELLQNNLKIKCSIEILDLLV
ncbi:DUF4911 domain-containing protein [Thermodesulfobacterium hydrogeniphilum]|uniref:DUF4911 domain-containing protein n=1 Tax=Thermodesulfobacterium hydrogeniphilum TaxID=161156 RepID=UPI0005704B90|nr:DUF4911 domain-containing protein [Thermodesulfobacterium hydrogeniphilum]